MAACGSIPLDQIFFSSARVSPLSLTPVVLLKCLRFPLPTSLHEEETLITRLIPLGGIPNQRTLTHPQLKQNRASVPFVRRPWLSHQTKSLPGVRILVVHKTCLTEMKT